MLELVCDLQVTHNGAPVQLLYLKWRGATAQAWQVRPLFETGPDREEIFRATDSVQRLHTQRLGAGARC